MTNLLKLVALASSVEMASPSITCAIEMMKKNLHKQLCQIISDRPDLILLRECSDRYNGHSLVQRLEYYNARGEQIRDFLLDFAKSENVRIVYSYVRNLANGIRYNSSVCLTPDGKIEWSYDKNYPMPNAEIDIQNIHPGKPPADISTPLGRIGAMICFDINFNELREHYRKLCPQLLLFSSFFDGGILRNWWAFRCRSYLLSATPVGAALVDPLGREVARSTEYTPYLSVKINIDYRIVHWDNNWEKIMALKAEYGSNISIIDPGHSGVVMIKSESENFSIIDILNKFEIVDADTYLDEAATKVHSFYKLKR
jgi:hypothetical protein